MDREALFIKRVSKASKFIGDDAAVIGEWTYSSDTFFEDIHFKSSWMSFKQIAYKSMAINISDAIAMNAEPKYALLSVALPRSISAKGTIELAEGFIEAATFFGVELIGGDTIVGKKIDISITIVSKTRTKTLMRSGAKIGDIVAYTGTLGQSRRELLRLLSGGKVSKKGSFVKPVLRRGFMKKSAKFLNSAMDISDGLGADLQKMFLGSSKTLKYSSLISKEILCSGEEYELIVTFSKNHLKAVIAYAKKSRTPLNIVGVIRRGSYISRCKTHHK